MAPTQQLIHINIILKKKYELKKEKNSTKFYFTC